VRDERREMRGEERDERLAGANILGILNIGIIKGPPG
jgi:hypothetical protein